MTGRVLNSANQEGVPFATVTVAGGLQGTQANEQGTFRLTVPGTDVLLQARAIGYKRTEVRLPVGQTEIDITLERDVLQLEGVVVTGQATSISKANAATAVSIVSADALNRNPAQVIESALQGKVIGARINMNSGAPGGGGQVQIRGVTTILGNGQPLYVVDGVIISNAQIQSGANTITGASNRNTNIASAQDNATNRLADINPNDIETVEVLKGAAASAIYGSRATNGVVIITTKRGQAGSPRFALTQRLGTYDAIRLPGSRRFLTKADALEAVIVNMGTGNTARAQQIVDAAYAANPNPFYDYQEQLYGESDLSYETAASVSGGTETTRYFVSASTKKDDGIMLNTGAKRDALRVNVDQAIGSTVRVDVGASITRSVADRGLSNNDNSYTSPLYAFGYTPAILDLAQRDANGNFPENPFPAGGGRNASNPFQTLSYITNREDVWRQIGSANLRWDALSSDRNQVRVTVTGGVDRFNQDNKVYSPNFLQFEGSDGFFGRSVQGNANSLLLTGSANAIWTFSPISIPFTATTSFGVQGGSSDVNEYRIQARGLVPGVDLVNQGTVATAQRREKIIDQALYFQEEILAFEEKLLVSAGLRADRSSANGDRDKYFVFPKGSASYRFVSPFPYADEIKLRAAVGQSGNRPLFAQRELVLQNTGRIGGREALGANPTLGNPDVEPERMREQEYGIDARFMDDRVSLEATYFDRTITKLLLQAPLAPSSGLTQQIFNGGEMVSEGWEFGLTFNPIRNLGGVNWISRVTYFTIDQRVTDLPVPAFLVGSTGFGAAFGRVRIAEGASTTAIWGNAPFTVNGTETRYAPEGIYATNPSAVAFRRDTIVGDATPDFEMQFGNDLSWRNFSLNVLLDWRKGGDVSNLTNVLFDEGYTSRDFDDPSPVDGMKLGEYRYAAWNGGSDARVYVQDGSFVKLREVTLSYTVPPRFVERLGRINDMRLSLSGRNLAIWSDYWGSDPEVNNFGNQNVGRFVDLAPYPPSRSFFFSVDVNF